MPSHGWFDVVEFPHGVTMIAEPGHHEDVKSFLIEGSERVAIFDTGMGIGDFKSLADSLSDREPIVIQSHAHIDHIGASCKYDDVRIHPAEADNLRHGGPHEAFRGLLEEENLRDVPLPETLELETAHIPGAEPTAFVEDGDLIDLGDRTLTVIHTPGHSPGGITLIDREHRQLFPGDAIYMGPMFAYRPYSDPAAYRESLRKLADLSAEVDTVFPSHNRVPLSPADVVRMHTVYEGIWAGREPDEQLPDRDIFRFDGFEFWLRPGAYGVDKA